MAQWVLKQYLRKRRISVRAFSKLIHARYDNIWRVLRKDYDPKLSFINRCMRGLGCKLKDLIKE